MPRDITVYDNKGNYTGIGPGTFEYDPKVNGYVYQVSPTERRALIPPDKAPLKGPGFPNMRYIGTDPVDGKPCFLPEDGDSPARLLRPRARSSSRDTDLPDPNILGQRPQLPASGGPTLATRATRVQLPEEDPRSTPSPDAFAVDGFATGASLPFGSQGKPAAPVSPRSSGITEVGTLKAVPLPVRHGREEDGREDPIVVPNGILGPALSSRSPVPLPPDRAVVPSPIRLVKPTAPAPMPRPAPVEAVPSGPPPQRDPASRPPLFRPSIAPPPHAMAIPLPPRIPVAPPPPAVAAPPLVRRQTTLPPVYAAGSFEQVGNGRAPLFRPRTASVPTTPVPRLGPPSPPEPWRLAELFRTPPGVRPDYDYNLSMVPFSPFQTLPGRDRILEALKRYHVLDFLRNSINDIGDIGQGLVQLPKVVGTVDADLHQALFDQAKAVLADVRGDKATARAARAHANARLREVWQMAKDSVGGDDGFAARTGRFLAYKMNAGDQSLDEHTRLDAQRQADLLWSKTWRDFGRNVQEHPVQTVLNLTPFMEGAMAYRAGQLGRAAEVARAAGNLERAAALESQLNRVQRVSRAIGETSHQVQNLGTPAAFDAARSLLNERFGGNLAYRTARRSVNSVLSRGKEILDTPVFRRSSHDSGGNAIFRARPLEELDVHSGAESATASVSNARTYPGQKPRPDRIKGSYGETLHKKMKDVHSVWEGRLAHAQADVDKFTDALNTVGERHEKLLKKGIQPNVQEMQYAVHQLQAASDKQALLQAQYKTKAKKELHQVLFAPNSLAKKGIPIRFATPITDRRLRVMLHSADFVSNLVADTVGSSMPTLQVTHAPRIPNQRYHSYYTHPDRTIALRTGETIGGGAHEVIHGLENSKPEILAATTAYYHFRTGNEQLHPLGGDYGPNELTRQDGFLSPYTGKEYVTGGRRTDTEILTMGVQYLYDDPLWFAKNDPDHFDFVMSVLHDQPYSNIVPYGVSKGVAKGMIESLEE